MFRRSARVGKVAALGLLSAALVSKGTLADHGGFRFSRFRLTIILTEAASQSPAYPPGRSLRTSFMSLIPAS
jgi:hypothetical protein